MHFKGAESVFHCNQRGEVGGWGGGAFGIKNIYENEWHRLITLWKARLEQMNRGVLLNQSSSPELPGLSQFFSKRNKRKRKKNKQNKKALANAMFTNTDRLWQKSFCPLYFCVLLEPPFAFSGSWSCNDWTRDKLKLHFYVEMMQHLLLSLRKSLLPGSEQASKAQNQT